MRTIRKERFYPYPPEAVWVALTDPRALAEWLMPNNFRAEVGATFEFCTDPAMFCKGGTTPCRVLELDPPRRMVWGWSKYLVPGEAPSPPSRVTWLLTPHEGGTRLVLEHTGFEGWGFMTPFLMNMGWGMMMKKSIPTILANTRARGGGYIFEPGGIPLVKRYYKVKTVPAMYVR